MNILRVWRLQVLRLVPGIQMRTIQITYRRCGAPIGDISRSKELLRSGLVSLARNYRRMRIDNGLQPWFNIWEQALGESTGPIGRGIPTLKILVVFWKMTGKRSIRPSSNTSIPFCSRLAAVLLAPIRMGRLAQMAIRLHL